MSQPKDRDTPPSQSERTPLFHETSDPTMAGLPGADGPTPITAPTPTPIGNDFSNAATHTDELHQADDDYEDPTEIGPYRILGILGEGGMGKVYLAEQSGALQRKVALKVIRDGEFSRQTFVRFRGEQRSLSMVNHPAISAVYAADVTPDGFPYFAMEYIPGQPVTKFCDEHKLSLRQRIELFIEICEGIHHAHRRGVIHRDIKPSNILVFNHEGKPTPKIIDFGIAKVNEGGENPLTRQGGILGTPMYMSPEQAQGMEVDTRADVYSLTAALYQLLSGRVPFSEISRQSLFQQLQAVVTQEVIQPSKKFSSQKEADQKTIAANRNLSPKQLKAMLSGDLDWIILKGLKKDPENRYGSVVELINDLRCYLTERPVTVGPPGFGYRARKFIVRYKAAAIFAGLFVVALVGGMAATGTALIQAKKAREVAEAEAETSREVSNFLENLFENTNPDKALGKTITAHELLDSGSEKIDRDLADQPQIQIRLKTTIGEAYRRLGFYQKSQNHFEEIVRIQRLMSGSGSLEVADKLDLLGNLYRQRGMFREAESTMKESLGILEEKLGSDHITVGNAYNSLGLLYLDRQDYKLADEYLEKALAIREAKWGSNHENLAYTLNGLGISRNGQKKNEEAVAFHTRALKIRENLLDPYHTDIGQSTNNLARALSQLGRDEEAEIMFSRTLKVWGKSLGEDHPRMGITHFLIGEHREKGGKLDTAEQSYKQSLQTMEKALAPDHPHLSYPMLNLAKLYTSQGHFQKAEPLLRRSLAIRRQAYAADHDLVKNAASALDELIRKRDSAGSLNQRP